MANLVKKEWIEEQKRKYNVNSVGKLSHAQMIFNEAEKCFINDLNYATIFCIHAAMTSLLSQKMNLQLERKKNNRRFFSLSLKELVKKTTLITIDTKLKDEIINFSEIRDNLEHPKDPSEDLFADWEQDLEEETFLRMKVFKKGEKLYFCVEEKAKTGLLLYYRLCEEILKELTAVKEKKE